MGARAVKYLGNIFRPYNMSTCRTSWINLKQDFRAYTKSELSAYKHALVLVQTMSFVETSFLFKAKESFCALSQLSEKQLQKTLFSVCKTRLQTLHKRFCKQQ